MQAERDGKMHGGVSNAGPRLAGTVVLTLGLVALAVGCVKVKDTLTLNADGTGSVEIETVSYLGDYDAAMGYPDEMLPTGQASYPPLLPAAAKRLFPPEDFTVTTERKKTPAGEPVTIVKASFKDVNRLLASPYAQAHSLWMGLDAGTLTVKALTGLQAYSSLETLPDMEEYVGRATGAKDTREKMQKLHVDFTLTLPAAPKAEGAVVKGNSATWTVDRGALKDARAAAEALRAVMTASCAADGVKFKPVSAVRLDLGSFADLQEGPVDEKVPVVDAEKVRAAAKFVPLLFQWTRGFDLSGEGYGHESSASLLGMVVLPRELAPQTWGRVELTEATDDQGDSLVPMATERTDDRWSYLNRSRMMYPGPDETPRPRTDVRHVVAISMKPPVPAVKTLRRVRASVEVGYAGTRHVIKVKGIVKTPTPATAEKKPGMEQEELVETEEMEETALVHPKLTELGLRLVVSGVYYRSGGTSIMLRRTGRGALLTAIQVFDAKGNPCPTFTLGMGGDADDERSDLAVAGQPEGPLSLAFVVDAGGPTVKVPIVLRDVSIVPNEMKERPDRGDAPEE